MKLPLTLVEGGIYGWLIPGARTIAALFLAIMLGMVGGWFALTLNALVGYPWGAYIHLAIYVIGIGLGAGIGAYVCWINRSPRWYLVLGIFLLVLAIGVAGSAIGNAYWNLFTDPSYMGARDTRVNMTHFGGAVGACMAATAIGLYLHFRTRS